MRIPGADAEVDADVAPEQLRQVQATVDAALSDPSPTQACRSRDHSLGQEQTLVAHTPTVGMQRWAEVIGETRTRRRIRRPRLGCAEAGGV
jgi:hypothetical protein